MSCLHTVGDISEPGVASGVIGLAELKDCVHSTRAQGLYTAGDVVAALQRVGATDEALAVVIRSGIAAVSRIGSWLTKNYNTQTETLI